jgi:uncharacterized protein
MKLKTPYSSYCIKGIANGCKYCVKGEKLVLFISGVCSRNCYYCSLSEKRKNKDIIYANERVCKSPKEAIIEAIESNATSAGITGGDPLLYLNRTIKYASALKKRFGKSFHIHIYLPTKLMDDRKIRLLSKYIDEVRFNPEYSTNPTIETMYKDIEKVKLATKYFKKENIGIELPMIPDNKKEFLLFIKTISPYIGFANFNEFELSETNYKPITTNYKLNPGGYTIKDSIKAGIWLLKQLKKNKIKLNFHLCTAELKNNYQFKNRLKLHKILPYGQKTNEGLVKYLTIYATDNKDLLKLTKEVKKSKGYYVDKQKKRLILSEPLATKMILNKNFKHKICLVEEFPTYDHLETEKETISI